MQLQRPFAVITPTLDGPVLGVLANVDESFSASELSRILPEASRAGIRLCLQRLAEQGVLTVQHLPRNIRYSFNRDHLAAPAIVELARMRASLLARLEDELGTWGELAPVWSAIFGSAATGAMRADSDIDLFLVQPPKATESAFDQWSDRVATLAQDVSRWTGNDLRVLEMSVDDIRNAPEEPVLDDIVAVGVRITGKPDWLRRRVTAARRTSEER